MADNFTESSFGSIGSVITPGDVDLDPIAKAVVLLTAGNVSIVPENNANASVLNFVDLPAGYIIPYRVRRVTAATAVVASIDW